MIDRESPSAARAGRWPLVLPYVLIAGLAVAWGFGWFWLRDAALHAMDAGVRQAAAEGHEITWTGRSIAGFPFNLDLRLAGPRFRDTSGWAASAPRLEAKASVFSPGLWVFVAPDGVTLTRPGRGDVQINGTVLRASVSAWRDQPARIAVQGMGVKFVAVPGARPPSISAASELHIQTKAGPDHQGAVYVELDGVHPAEGAKLARIGAGSAVTLIADGIFNHADALHGRGIDDALRRWRNAGGVMNLRALSLRAGGLEMVATSGWLGLDAGGRITGAAPVRLTAADRALTVLGVGPAGPGATQIVARDGVTTLGGKSIGPAPRIY